MNEFEIGSVPVIYNHQLLTLIFLSLQITPDGNWYVALHKPIGEFSQLF